MAWASRDERFQIDGTHNILHGRSTTGATIPQGIETFDGVALVAEGGTLWVRWRCVPSASLSFCLSPGYACNKALPR